MIKPLAEYQFRPIKGVWLDVLGDSRGVLADTLSALNLTIDDKCTFARFKDYENMREIWYKAEAQRITITIWRINA